MKLKSITQPSLEITLTVRKTITSDEHHENEGSVGTVIVFFPVVNGYLDPLECELTLKRLQDIHTPDSNKLNTNSNSKSFISD